METEKGARQNRRPVPLLTGHTPAGRAAPSRRLATAQRAVGRCEPVLQQHHVAISLQLPQGASPHTVQLQVIVDHLQREAGLGGRWLELLPVALPLLVFRTVQLACRAVV